MRGVRGGLIVFGMVQKIVKFYTKYFAIWVARFTIYYFQFMIAGFGF